MEASEVWRRTHVNYQSDLVGALGPGRINENAYPGWSATQTENEREKGERTSY